MSDRERDRERDRRLRGAYDPASFRALGHRLVDRLADYLSEAETLAVMPWSEPDALAERWPASFPEDRGEDPMALFERVIAASVHQHHPRYLGHQVAVPFPEAALAEMLGALLNNGMASYEAGPLSSVLERNVTRWLASRIGLGQAADGFLTSGGTLGNLTALLAARQARAGFDAWSQGSGDAPLCVLSSELAHYSVERAVRVMGWGAGGTIKVPVDASYRMRADRLDEALGRAERAGRRAIGVVASACASASGVIDPLPDIARFCEARGLWMHVDGAHGASAAMCKRYRHLLDGIERADSVVWDAHKLLALPALMTAVLFREGERSFESFSQDASYLFSASERPHGYDLGQRNMECTKRMMSVTLYATLTILGTQVFDDYVGRQFDLARRFAAMIDEAPDFELAVAPDCNILCFRHRSSDDGLQDRLRQAVAREGRFYLTRAELGGRVYLRVTLMSPFTSEADLAALLDEVRQKAKNPPA
jgi:L-2,4-diaminobutyrate decarboxylase